MRLTFGTNRKQIVDVVPTSVIDLPTSVTKGRYVTTNSTTSAKHENMKMLYTARPMFFESLRAR